MAVTTFLFTDIEGSTRLWETHPGAMHAALAAHDETTTKTIDAHGGSVVKHMGDGAIAAFPTAGDAIDAAIALQTALADQVHPDVGALRVRMGIHSGEVEARDGDYFGPTLNRTARLMAAGHGGQVLVSLVTERLAGDRTDLVDLGEHRLRDLSRPERIFQVASDTGFPPLRTLDRAPNNLPVFATSFVGRHREFDEVAALLRANRLVTLTGVGGAGKTRLSLQVAADAANHFHGGVWFVPLAAVTDPDAVDGAMAEALGVGQEPGKPLRDSVLDHLADRTALLVVDNCEHLIDAAAEVVEEVLGRAPDVKVIATSRELLGVPGEVAYGLRSMRLPGRSETVTPATLAEFDAVQLFTERAAATKPDFRVDADNAEAILEVCRRLDGMPLALELAAARIRTFPPAKLADLLDQRFRLLTGGARTALPRQQTLAATIEWSYRLLDDQERTLLRRLSAFQSGFTFDAVTDVCATDPIAEFDVVELLPSLVDKSLVVADDSDDEPRYRLLETIRQFARDLFEDTHEADAVRLRHAEFFDRFAWAAKPHLRGPDEARWWRRIDDELDNLRQAMTWSIEHDQAALGLSIACGIWRHWWFSNKWSDGIHWLERLLEAAGIEIPEPLRAEALLGLGSLGTISGELDDPLPLLEEAYDRWQALRHAGADPDLLRGSLPAAAINLAAEHSNRRGNHELALELNHEALALARELGNAEATSIALGNIALGHASGGDADEARRLFDEAAATARSHGSPIRLANLAMQRSLLELAAGEADASATAMAESARLHEAARDPVGARQAMSRAEALRLVADRTRPPEPLIEAIRAFAALPEAVGSRDLLTEMLQGRAAAEALAGRWEAAAVTWGAMASVSPPHYSAPRPVLELDEQLRAAAQEALGGGIYDEAFAEGESMTRDEMVALLLD